MPYINTTKPGLDSINLNSLPENTRHQILQFLELKTHHDNELSTSATGQRNTSQQSNPNDYDTPLPSPSTALSWTVMDSLDPPPTLSTNPFEPYPPQPEEGQYFSPK